MRADKLLLERVLARAKHRPLRFVVSLPLRGADASMAWGTIAA